MSNQGCPFNDVCLFFRLPCLCGYDILFEAEPRIKGAISQYLSSSWRMPSWRLSTTLLCVCKAPSVKRRVSSTNPELPQHGGSKSDLATVEWVVSQQIHGLERLRMKRRAFLRISTCCMTLHDVSEEIVMNSGVISPRRRAWVVELCVL